MYKIQLEVLSSTSCWPPWSSLTESWRGDQLHLCWEQVISTILKAVYIGILLDFRTPPKIARGHVRGKIFDMAQLDHTPKLYASGQKTGFISLDVSCLTRLRTEGQCSNLRFAPALNEPLLAPALNEPLRNNDFLISSFSQYSHWGQCHFPTYRLLLRTICHLYFELNGGVNVITVLRQGGLKLHRHFHFQACPKCSVYP